MFDRRRRIAQNRFYGRARPVHREFVPKFPRTGQDRSLTHPRMLKYYAKEILIRRRSREILSEAVKSRADLTMSEGER